MSGVSSGIIGRDRELAMIGLTIDAALAGQPSFLLLLGEPGIGKTTLLTATLAMARQRGLRSLRGVAIESGASLPYLPLLAPLAACVADVPEHPGAALVRAGLLGETAAEPNRDGDRDDARAARLVEAIYTLLSARPTLFAVDDIQWADPATLAILDYTSHRAVDVPLAIVAAARDDERDRLERVAIADGRRFVRVAVRPLSREEVSLQLESLGGVASIGDLDSIYARTAGNPFFVEQVHAAGAEAGGRQGPTPGSLQVLVQRRIERLSVIARVTLDALAVFDRPVDLPLVAATAGLDIDAARAAVDEAVRAGVAGSSAEGVRLRHPLFGEVLRAELPGPERAELHRRAADALEVAGSDAATIAGHRWQAGDPTRAWSAALAAADDPARRFAFAAVRLHLERALQVWPEEATGRAAAGLRAAEAAWHAGDAPAALDHALAAEAALPDPGVTLIEVLLAQGSYAWDAGDRAIAVAAFDRVQGLITPDTSPSLRSRALWGLGRGEVGHGQHLDAVQHGLEAAAIARDAWDLVEEAKGLQLAGAALNWSGSTNIDVLERGLAVALASGDPETIGHGHHFLADSRWIGGDLDRALEVAAGGVERCDQIGLARSHGADLRGYAAFFLLELGRPAEAAAILADADPRAQSELAQARLAIRRGAFGEARAALERMRTSGGIGGPGIRGGWAELTEVELAALQGDPRRALDWLHRIVLGPGSWGIDTGAWTTLWSARIEAELRRARGRPAGAELEVEIDHGPVDAHPDIALAGAIRTELAALAADRSSGSDPVAPDPVAPDPAVRWREAVAAWSAARRPYEACRARLGEVHALLNAGRRADARTALRAMTQAAEALECQPLVDAATDVARRSRIDVRASRRSRPDPNEPTRRELEVLAHLAEGLTNPQIAARLFISPKTIDIHVSRILDKMGAHTRGEAVAIARRRRLL